MIKNIVFDWSGILSDDIRPVYDAVMIVFDNLDLKRISFGEFRREFELPYINFYKKHTKNVKKEEVDQLYSAAIKTVGKAKPFPEARKMLEFLKEKGIKMAVISSHPQETIEEEIKDYGFSGFFVYIGGSVHDKREEISNTMNRCGFEKEETAYVGDMTHDIEAGKKAGVMTIAVYRENGYSSKEELSDAKPDELVEGLYPLRKIVFGIRS